MTKLLKLAEEKGWKILDNVGDVIDVSEDCYHYKTGEYGSPFSANVERYYTKLGDEVKNKSSNNVHFFFPLALGDYPNIRWFLLVFKTNFEKAPTVFFFFFDDDKKSKNSLRVFALGLIRNRGFPKKEDSRKPGDVKYFFVKNPVSSENINDGALMIACLIHLVKKDTVDENSLADFTFSEQKNKEFYETWESRIGTSKWLIQSEEEKTKEKEIRKWVADWFSKRFIYFDWRKSGLSVEECNIAWNNGWDNITITNRAIFSFFKKESAIINPLVHKRKEVDRVSEILNLIANSTKIEDLPKDTNIDYKENEVPSELSYAYIKGLILAKSWEIFFKDKNISDQDSWKKLGLETAMTVWGNGWTDLEEMKVGGLSVDKKVHKLGSVSDSLNIFISIEKAKENDALPTDKKINSYDEKFSPVKHSYLKELRREKSWEIFFAKNNISEGIQRLEWERKQWNPFINPLQEIYSNGWTDPNMITVQKVTGDIFSIFIPSYTSHEETENNIIVSKISKKQLDNAHRFIYEIKQKTTFKQLDDWKKLNQISIDDLKDDELPKATSKAKGKQKKDIEDFFKTYRSALKYRLDIEVNETDRDGLTTKQYQDALVGLGEQLPSTDFKPITAELLNKILSVDENGDWSNTPLSSKPKEKDLLKIMDEKATRESKPTKYFKIDESITNQEKDFQKEHSSTYAPWKKSSLLLPYFFEKIGEWDETNLENRLGNWSPDNPQICKWGEKTIKRKKDGIKGKPKKPSDWVEDKIQTVLDKYGHLAIATGIGKTTMLVNCLIAGGIDDKLFNDYTEEVKTERAKTKKDRKVDNHGWNVVLVAPTLALAEDAFKNHQKPWLQEWGCVCHQIKIPYKSHGGYDVKLNDLCYSVNLDNPIKPDYSGKKGLSVLYWPYLLGYLNRAKCDIDTIAEGTKGRDENNSWINPITKEKEWIKSKLIPKTETIIIFDEADFFGDFQTLIEMVVKLEYKVLKMSATFPKMRFSIDSAHPRTITYTNGFLPEMKLNERSWEGFAKWMIDNAITTKTVNSKTFFTTKIGMDYPNLMKATETEQFKPLSFLYSGAKNKSFFNEYDDDKTLTEIFESEKESEKGKWVDGKPSLKQVESVLVDTNLFPKEVSDLEKMLINYRRDTSSSVSVDYISKGNTFVFVKDIEEFKVKYENDLKEAGVCYIFLDETLRDSASDIVSAVENAIIFGENTFERGFTFNIKRVIITGWIKVSKLKGDWTYEYAVSNITWASFIQEYGRIGRLFEGYGYTLIDDFEDEPPRMKTLGSAVIKASLGTWDKEKKLSDTTDIEGFNSSLKDPELLRNALGLPNDLFGKEPEVILVGLKTTGHITGQTKPVKAGASSKNIYKIEFNTIPESTNPRDEILVKKHKGDWFPEKIDKVQGQEILKKMIGVWISKQPNFTKKISLNQTTPLIKDSEITKEEVKKVINGLVEREMKKVYEDAGMVYDKSNKEFSKDKKEVFEKTVSLLRLVLEVEIEINDNNLKINWN